MSPIHASPSSDADGGDPRVHSRLAEGSRVGRYVVMHCVGAGANGVVYAAYDPELDRRVALKLLAGDDELTVPGSHRDRRLLREAQALARVHHAHVVNVHDVGVWNDRVFLAMEFATGGTVRQWLTAGPRTWREVLAVLRGAGEGLAAAHAAGLVHRDFKPDNVLLLEDGRAIVTDFGLARPAGLGLGSGLGLGTDDLATGSMPLTAFESSATHPVPRRAHPDALAATLTATGTLAGTPAYMAPEQFDGATADARSDQFAFSVTLFEALFGARPFGGATIDALVAALDDGPQFPGRGRDVPRWLRRAVVRGLAIRPGDRHRDMQALLATLAGPRRLGRAKLAGLGLCAGGLALVALSVDRAPAPATYCDDVAAKLEPTWDAAARTALSERFAATELSFADDVASRVTAGLDGFAREWIDAQTEACRAGVEGAVPAAELDARTTCLDRQRDEFMALTAALAQADAQGVMQAVDAALGLPRVADCADAKPGRQALPPIPDAERDAVGRARALIHEGTALRILAKNQESLIATEAALVAATPTGYAPVIAEAKIALAESLVAAGLLDRAEPMMHAAFSEGLAANHDRVVADAAREIAFLEMNRMADPALIEMWARTGLAALQGLGTPQPDLWAELTDFLGTAQRRAGHTDAALETLREVVALRERHRGPHHYTVAQSLASLGMVYARRGEHELSVAHIERARQILLDTYGEHHPHYGSMLQNLGSTHYMHGSYRAALGLYDESHRLLAGTLGPRHPTVAVLAYNLATVMLSLESFDEAERYLREAQSIEEPLHGTESLQNASRLYLFAEIFLRSGRLEQAEQASRDALAVTTRIAPTNRARRANCESQLGYIVLLAGRLEEAKPLLEHALAEQAAVVGDPSIEVAETSGRLAMLELGRGRPAQASAAIDRSITQYETEDPDPHQHAQGWFRRAQILLAVGDRETARVQSERARTFYAHSGDQPSRLRAIEAWIDALDATPVSPR